MATGTARTCPECGAQLPAGTVVGQCPNCLLGLGLVGAEAALVGQRVEDGGRVSEISDQKSEVGGQTAEANNQLGVNGPPLAIRHSPLGTALGDYELVEEIGHGGMGVVYKARQRSLDRIVALKLLLFGPHAPPESVKRFRAEAVATAALQHPNIVAIHEVGCCAGQHFLVMDFVSGSSLAKLIGNQPLPAKRAAGYVKTIAEAIHYAHEHGLLHRDLKPSNILIDANDQPRVTDFGLAKRLAGDSELTVSGQVLGSPNYMPPEQAAGRRGTVSRRSDVYALGAILYHALTGRPPFVGEGLADTVQQVLNVEPVSPRVLNPKLPTDLETVCLKCLEKEPGKRYATAQMLAKELGRFLEGKPVLARPVGRLAKTWRWCRRNPRLALATGAALLSLLIGLAGVAWQWRSARLHARQEALQRQRAEAEALFARRNAYAADMKEVQRALDDSDLGRALELLDQYRPQGKAKSRKQEAEIDLRGWEWRYLWARCQSDERFTLCRYSNSVTALAFSSDGKWLAVRRGNRAVAVWDTVSRRSIAELPGAGYYKALAVSPRANLLACGNKDGNGAPVVSLWDVSAGKETARFPLSTDLVSVAFSPDAKAMAALAYDGNVRVWDVEARQMVTNFPTARVDVQSELFSEAATVKATSAAGGTARPRESNSPQVRPLVTRSKAFTDHCGCVLFSRGGLLAVGEVQARIRLFDWVTGEEKQPILVPPGQGITALAFSPDGMLLAAGCEAGDNDVHVWDLATRTERRLTGHSGWVVGLAFSPDGQTLASVSADQTLRLWDVAWKAEPRRFKGHTGEVWALAWSPDGQNLVTGGEDGSVRYWAPAAKPAAPYAVVPEQVWFWGPAFLPDSETFLTVTWPEGLVVRRKAATMQEVERLPLPGTNHSSLDLSSDGHWLALGDRAGNLQVWDFMAHRPVTNLVFPESGILLPIFLPRRNMLVCGSVGLHRPTSLKLWAVDGWRELSLQGINLTNLWEPTFSPNERTLAIGYHDGTAAWWDLATGHRQAFFDCHYASPVYVAFSPDGRLFATAGINGPMTVWDVATQRPKPIGRGYGSALHNLVFSPDGQRLIATGSSPKGLAKLWDVKTGREVAALPGEAGWFTRIGFSPDGNTLFAASLEGRALLWRAPSWEEIGAKEKEKRVP